MHAEKQSCMTESMKASCLLSCQLVIACTIISLHSTLQTSIVSSKSTGIYLTNWILRFNFEIGTSALFLGVYKIEVPYIVRKLRGFREAYRTTYCILV